jgi:hypothetical protein
VTALERWNDGRLDDLQVEVRELRASVGRLHETLGNVGVLAEQIKGLRTQFDDVNRDLEAVGGHPHQERRERNKLIIVGVISGIATGSVGAIVGVLAGVHP